MLFHSYCVHDNMLPSATFKGLSGSKLKYPKQHNKTMKSRVLFKSLDLTFYLSLVSLSEVMSGSMGTIEIKQIINFTVLVQKRKAIISLITLFNLNKQF